MPPDPVGTRHRLLLVTPYYTPHLGGVERYVESLARELRRQTGWTITIATSGEAGLRKATVTTTDGITVYRLPWTRRLSNTPVSLSWPGLLNEILVRERPTLVNAHAPVPGLADLAARLCRTCPFVLTYHTGPMTKDRLGHELLVRGYQRYVLPRTVRRAAAVITASDYVREHLPATPRGPVVTIHPGVDLDRFTPPDREQAGTPARALFVGSLDRAARYKDLPNLLRALRLLKTGGLEIPLTVAGDGDARRDHEVLARSLGLGSQVRFAGTLTGGALVTAYQESTVTVLPTLFESFATVLAEAMACGRPVIASDTGGVPELVRHGTNGLLVPPGDTRKLADAMETLGTDTELYRRLADGARTTATAHLDWRHQARTTADLFGQVVGRHARLGEMTTS